MCIKAGVDELDSVCNLAGMAVAALVCDVCSVEFDAITPDTHLIRDLGMNEGQSAALVAGIADLFDGLQLKLSPVPTVGALAAYLQKNL